jgi:hypothetical protein
LPASSSLLIVHRVLTSLSALEVIADGRQPPTFSITSPTQRAFTFPINDSIADGPFSSPLSSRICYYMYTTTISTHDRLHDLTHEYHRTRLPSGVYPETTQVLVQR